MTDYAERAVPKIQKIKAHLKLVRNKISRILNYKSAYFFDANMVITNSASDRRWLKLFTLNKRYFLTEKIKQETADLLKKDGYRRTNKTKFGIVTFDQLREITPEICPVYYNFILQMNNPAVVLSPDFFVSRLNALHLKQHDFSKDEVVIKQKVMDRLKKFNEKVDKSIEDLGQRVLPKSVDIKFQKKKRTAIRKNDPHYFNDYRSVALALLYCLSHKENVTFITADSDMVNLVLGLTEAILDQWALKAMILPLLTDADKEAIILGKEKEYFINPNKLAESRVKLMQELYSDEWKKKSFLFRTKYWNIEEQRYYNIDLTFDETCRMHFLKATGQYNCPPAKNSELGNWLSLKYWWPPEKPEDIDKMRVVVSKKSLITYHNKKVPSEIHNLHCLYAQEDKKNNFSFFCSFIDTDKF